MQSQTKLQMHPLFRRTHSLHLMTHFNIQTHLNLRLSSQTTEIYLTFPLYFSKQFSTLMLGFEILKGIFFF